MQNVKSWLLAHRIWVVVGLVLVVLAGSIGGILVGQARQEERDRENQRIADAARRQEEALMKQQQAEASPSPATSPGSIVTPSPTSKTSPAVSKSTPSSQASPSTSVASSSTATVSWSHNGSEWQSSGTPPSCPSPLTLTTPVDLSIVTNMLYPGQTRGTDYKPHGGFRFDGSSSDAITVKAPMNATLVQGSRYLESGEVQYLFDFINSCGIMYRFDHLRVLGSKLAEVANQLPEPKPDDSRTTPLSSGIAVTAGETIATGVGFANNPAVDLGVYDLRQKNTASLDAGYVSAHQSEGAHAFYAVCWLDWFSSADSATVKALPGSGTEGKKSDYCK